MKIRSIPGASILLLVSVQVSALTISVIGPSSYNSDTDIMNANLGLDSTYIIEDFEDDTWVSGLNVSSNDNGGIIVGTGKGRYWDGIKSLDTYRDLKTSDPIFTFDNAIESFGIGISLNNRDVAEDIMIYVDGVNVGGVHALTNYVPGQIRNGYLFINADVGEEFTEIGLLEDWGDYIEFDHLAFEQSALSPVPVPAAIRRFGTALVGMVGFTRRG